MKKLISQICAITILSTSINTQVFAQANNGRSETIRQIFAEYTVKMERAEGSIKSLSEAAIALRDLGVEPQEIVDYVAEGMDTEEASAYRASVESKLAIADSENMSELLKEATATLSKGSNFYGCSDAGAWVTAAVGATSILFFFATIVTNGDKIQKEEKLRELRLQKTDLESDIKIYLGEGVRPDSYLIASIQKDIAYLDEQTSQAETDYNRASEAQKNSLIITAATGAVAAVGIAKGCSL